MSLELTQKIQTTFDLATLRHEANMLEQKRQAQLQTQGQDQTQSNEWRRLREIKEQHQQARDDLKEHYRETMDQRMEQARAEVQKTLTAFNPQPRPPHELGAVHSNQFDNELFERRAEKLVERDFQRDTLKIDLSETGSLKEHLEGPLAFEYAQHREGQSHDKDRTEEQDRTQNPAEAKPQDRSLSQLFQPTR